MDLGSALSDEGDGWFPPCVRFTHAGSARCQEGGRRGKKMERQFSWLTDKQTRWLQRIRRARSQVSPDGSLYDTRPHQGAPRDDEYVNNLLLIIMMNYEWI